MHRKNRGDNPYRKSSKKSLETDIIVVNIDTVIPKFAQGLGDNVLRITLLHGSLNDSGISIL